MDAIYSVNVSSVIGPQYIDLINDISRMLIIQISIQLMYYTLNPERFRFFTTDFFMMLLFIVIGVLMYWLVFKKIVVFK